jgi:Lrp/AsnC family transcriptional regulator, leucine-responsive regulatory protein
MNHQNIRLDMKDKKLLFALDLHGREPNSALAKKIGLSTQGVDYKLAVLEKLGVISGYYPVIEIGRLGYFYCRLFFKWQNLTEEKEAELFEQLVAEPRINWIVKLDGAYDLVLAAYMKTLEDFKRLSEDLLERYGFFIMEKKESIGLSLVHMNNRYLVEGHSEELIMKGTPDEMPLDLTDKKLLMLLSKNARASMVELARNMKISPKVVAYRLRKLERNGIILGYRPNINYEKIGYVHYKILFYLSNVKRKELLKFKSYLRTLPELVYIVEQVGVADVDIELMLPKDASLFSFLKKVKFYVPGLIRDYEILIAGRTLKIEYVPF